MRGRLIIPAALQDEVQLMPPASGEIVRVRETGQVFVGDGVSTITEIEPLSLPLQATITTEDGSEPSIATIEIDDNTCGILEVRLHATDNTDTLHGQKLVAFKKISGTLTIEGTTDVMPDTGTLATSWTVSNDAENLSVFVTGIELTTVNWKVIYKTTTLSITPAT